MGNLYAATLGQNPGVARIYIYTCTKKGGREREREREMERK